MNSTFSEKSTAGLTRELLQIKLSHDGIPGELSFGPLHLGGVVRIPGRDIFVTPQKVSEEWKTVAAMDGIEIVSAENHKEMSSLDAELRNLNAQSEE